MEFEPLNHTPLLPEWTTYVLYAIFVILIFLAVIVTMSYLDRKDKPETKDEVESEERRMHRKAIPISLALVAFVFISTSFLAYNVKVTGDKIDDGYDKNLSLKYDTESFQYEFPRSNPNEVKDGKVFKIRIITDTAVVEARTSYDPETGEPSLYDYVDGSTSSTNQNFSVADLEK